jgi:Fur family transcriptional regulator, ferric uptake regulator
VTAQVLWRRLRDRGDSTVGLATVYRTLALLRDHDVVDAMSHHGGELCYRLCTDGHHHHLVCRECHRVVELHDCGLDEWVSGLAAQHGFARPEHHLEIDGVCADCAGPASRVPV